LAGDSPSLHALQDYEKALLHPENTEALQKAYEVLEHQQGWDLEMRFRQVLGKLEIHDLEQKISSLSGGQKKRVALAKLLVEEPDVIIMDEPTNHLDLEMVEWLEEHLSREGLTLFMVTHDRYFLDRVCTDILELEDQTLYRYKGNYSYFLEKKAERQEQVKTETERAQNLFRKELDWMRRTPQARTTKSKARISSFYEIKETAGRRVKDDQVQMEIQTTRMGSKIVEFHKVKKAYGEKRILDGFSYTFKRGERVGLVGRNGSGKSTFLQILTGQMQPDGGKVVVGDTIKFGYYKQDGLKFRDDQKVIDVIKDIAEVLPLAKGRKLTAAQLLERFLFDRKQQYVYVSKLSGGEKRRLYLLTLLMDNPNFLILDEPTNDLDIVTLQVLEDFLEDFEGCLLIVSHDRHFMNRLVDHLFVLDGKGNVKDYIGDYEDYRQALKEEKSAEKVEKVAAVAAAAAKEKKKLNYNEQREFDGLLDEIAKMEKRKEEITGMFEAGLSDNAQIAALSQELSDIEKRLEQKSNRWLELSEWA
jgi:ATP-binding cassette subfamily F protein uup